MFKTVFVAAAAVASLGASPSIAAPVGAAPAALAGATTAEATPTKAATQRTRETRYCVIATVTGSIIPHKECRTRNDWIQLTGIDPLEKN